MKKYYNLEQAYKDELIGREFVYQSKYGSETFSKVADIMIRFKMSADKETSRVRNKIIAEHSSKVKTDTIDTEPIKVERKWSGIVPVIEIISENGNYYELGSDQIYFLI